MSNLILNERAYIEELIRQKDLGATPYRTVFALARYYRSLGYKPKAIREEIERFMIRCDPDINLVRWNTSIEKAIQRSSNRKLIELDSIPITQKEIDKCKSLDSSAYQRLAFSLLCIAKYFNTLRDTNNNWVNQSDKDIFSLANIQTVRKRQPLMLGKLGEEGFVEFSNRIDNTNLRVTFVDTDGDPILKITELHNLGWQYERFLFGDKYYPTCEICGEIFRKKKNVRGIQKYCTKCAAEVKRRKSAATRK